MGVTIRPFSAVRPQRKYAAQVAELPYDVMNADEARTIAKGNPYSFLHVDKAEIDLPPDVDPYDPRVYAKAKENLDAFVRDDVLFQDGRPNFYIYRLDGYGNTQTGLAACVSTEEYERGLIKKHEFTRADKEQDRVNHVSACSAHTGPIFLAYRAEGAAQPKDLMEEWIASHEPEYDFTADDGVRHVLWVVDDERTQNALAESFRSVQHLYIADGHHRNASALKVAAMRNGELPKPDESAEHNFYLGIIFPHDELMILDYNRLIKDLNGKNTETFIQELQNIFIIEKSEKPVKPVNKHVFGMYLSGVWYSLTLKAHTDPADVIGSLDVSVLQEKVLSPVLNIRDPKTDKRIDFVGGVRGLDELARRVDSGEMAVAFSMCPTSMDELMAVADAGFIMPPKSTWFEPKLRSGLLVHVF